MTYGRLSPSWPVEALGSLSFVTVHVFLYQTKRPMVACHLVSWGCGMTRSCVLGANARFPTEYNGKGNGLTSLAWHTPCDAPVPMFNAQCAQAASSGRPIVTKLHARFHFGCAGFETAVTCFFVFLYSSTVCSWVIS